VFETAENSLQLRCERGGGVAVTVTVSLSAVVD